jgi:DNA-binding LacI/PurR family transcriptional regulator
MPIDSVVTDNAEAMAAATRHLLALGHRKFALVGGPLDHITAIDRQRGFVRTLEEAGLGRDDYVIENGQWELNGFHLAAQRLLARVEPPLAMLTVNNDATTGTLRALRERGWRIPQDVAFVGFDELPWTEAYNPALTVVDQHPYHIGAVAAELLMARIRNPERPVQQVKLQCELVVRQSCGAGSL